MTEPITAPTYGTYRWFCRAVGRYLGLDADWNIWNHEQENRVDDIVQSGLRKFYFPPPVDMQIRSHSWSFLRPVGRLATAAGLRVYDLPKHFDRFDGPLTFTEDEHYPPIKLVRERLVSALEYQEDHESYPVYAALRPKMSDGLLSQDQQLVLHPTPDDTYQLSYRFLVLPFKLDDTNKHPLGGEAYAEAIRAACLAEAELQEAKKAGPMLSAWKEQLAAAVARDFRRGPDLLGYNSDPSTISQDELNKDIRRVRDYLYTDVTYSGS